MTTVRTQKELDAAVERGDSSIVVDSPDGVWLELRGSSHVVARGSSHVEAWGSAHVVAWGSAHVVAWGSSHVEAWDSSHVVARGSAHVEAWGSSHVEAWDSSHVEAWDSAHVEAANYVAVHLYSQRVTLSGGVLIDMTHVDPTDTDTWLELTGAKVIGKRVIVFKAVRDDYRSCHGTLYSVGGKASCDDFRALPVCGGGLHFSPSVAQAASYDTDATRFLRCEVKASEVQCIDSSKLKAPRCWVVAEVDRFGKDI